MADGSVRLDVDIDVSKADKDLAKLKDKIAKLETEVNKNSQQKGLLEEQMKVTFAQLDEAIDKVNYLKEKVASSKGDTKALYKEELSEALEDQRALNKEANQLYSEYERVNKKIATGSEKLEEMKSEAGALSQAIEEARPGEALAKSLDNARAKLGKFIKYAVGIRSVYILFQRLKGAISDSVRSFAEHDSETQESINNLKNALAGLKVSWGAAFAPILNAVAPILQTLIGWLTNAANAVARFLAIIGGRSTYKRAVANNNDLSSSIGGVGDAAKEAKKQLMGFDELNILSSDSNSGGGGGGGGGGPEVVEEAIDAFDGSFLSNLALSVKDVLFSWTDLNPEQIAEKIISGLSSILFAALGITLGFGAGGVLLMTLAGLSLGLVMDALIFDHDGELSKDEIGDMLATALGTFVGGAIGFVAGGPGGALIGATIGFGITLGLKALQVEKDGNPSGFITNLKDALNTFIGGVIGFSIGGIPGALIGATIAFGLTLGLKSVNVKKDGNPSGFITSLQNALNTFIGGAIGFTIGGIPGALFGATVAFGLTMGLKKIKTNPDGTTSTFIDDIKSAITSFVGGAIVFKLATAAGMALGPAGLVAMITLGVIFGLTKTKVENDSGEETTKEGWIEEIKSAINWPESGDFTEWVKQSVWEDGIKAGILSLWGFITTGEWPNNGETKESWVQKIFEKISFPTDEDVKAKLKQFFWEDGIKAFFLDLYSLITGSEWTGGTDAGTGLVDRIIEGMGGIGDKLQTWWDEKVAPWFTVEKWKELGATAMANIKAGLNSISLPKFHFSWEQAGYTGSFFGKEFTVNIPYPKLDWYASGGIFNSASVIGVGEAGSEAVVPLENTKWMDVIADRIMERMAESNFADRLVDAFVSTPMPAMATGSIAPPRALTGASGSQWNIDLLNEIKALRSEIYGLASQPVQVSSKTYIDKRQIGETVSEYQRETSRSLGR